jgi:hypothetical protein
MTVPAGNSGRHGGALPAPLVLVVISLFVLMVFETGEALRDRGALADLMRAQQPSIDQGAKIRQHLENLAGKTASLAAAGDTGAKSVLDQMKAQGVTLSAAKR